MLGKPGLWKSRSEVSAGGMPIPVCRALDSVVSEEPGRRLSELALGGKEDEFVPAGLEGRPEADRRTK